MRNALIFIFLFVSANADAGGLQQVQRYMEKHDVIFVGETHGGGHNAKVLSLLITRMVEEGKLDAFASEFIPIEANELLQSYLTEGDDNKVASKLRKLQNFTIGKMKSAWLARTEFLDLLSQLRLLKLRYNKNFHVCAIDDKPTIINRIPDNVLQLRKAKLSALSDDSISILRNTYDFDLDRYESDKGYQKFTYMHAREATMAQAAYECSKGRARTMVHAGEGHVQSLHLNSSKALMLPLSHFVKRLYNGQRKKYMTVLIESPAPDDKALEAGYCISCEPDSLSPMSTAFFSSWGEISKLFKKSQAGRELNQRQRALIDYTYLLEKSQDYYIIAPRAPESKYSKVLLDRYGIED